MAIPEGNLTSRLASQDQTAARQASHPSRGRKTWQNQRTFRKLISAIAAYVDSWIKNRATGVTAGILLLDCAGAYTSQAAMDILREFPQVKAVFIPPKMTGVLQPLDLTFFGPFKSLLKLSVARFLADCGRSLATLQAEEKPEYLKQCMAKKNILRRLTYQWLPTALKSMSARVVRNGFHNMCKAGFEHLEEGLSSEVDLHSTFWDGHLRTAEQWPSFEQRPKLKDKVYGDKLINYNLPYLRGLCRDYKLKVSGDKPELLERLGNYKTRTEDHKEFQPPAEITEGEESEGEGDEDGADSIITYQEEDAATEIPGDDDEDYSCGSVDNHMYEIDHFVGYITENDIEVKWKGYSTYHNTIIPK